MMLRNSTVNRFTQGYIDLYRTFRIRQSGIDGLRNLTIGKLQIGFQSCFNRKLESRFYVICKNVVLTKRLPICLINHFSRTVGGNHNQRNILVISFSNGRGVIQYCSARCTHKRHSFSALLSHS